MSKMKELFGEDYVEEPCSTQAEAISKSASYNSLLNKQALRTCIEVLKNLMKGGFKEADWTLQAPTLVKVMLGLKYDHYKSALLDQIKGELEELVGTSRVSHSEAQTFMIACEEAATQHTAILDTSSRMGQVGYQGSDNPDDLTSEEVSEDDQEVGNELSIPPMSAVPEISASQVALDEA